VGGGTAIARAARDGAAPAPALDLVHPALHLRDHTTVKPAAPLSLSRLLREIPPATARTLRRRLGRAGPRP
jgi:hypothetical protein